MGGREIPELVVMMFSGYARVSTGEQDPEYHGPAECTEDHRAAEVVVSAAWLRPGHLAQVGGQRTPAAASAVGRLQYTEPPGASMSQTSQARARPPVARWLHMALPPRVEPDFPVHPPRLWTTPGSQVVADGQPFLSGTPCPASIARRR